MLDVNSRAFSRENVIHARNFALVGLFRGLSGSICHSMRQPGIGGQFLAVMIAMSHRIL
jgi:hypothetical protein